VTRLRSEAKTAPVPWFIPASFSWKVRYFEIRLLQKEVAHPYLLEDTRDLLSARNPKLGKLLPEEYTPEETLQPAGMKHSEVGPEK